MFSEIIKLILSLQQDFSAHIVFGVGALLTGSYFMGRLAERFHLPPITGFILAGLFIGPSGIGLVCSTPDGPLASITEIALALIALVIGCEFSASKLRRIGKPVLIITIFKMTATFFIVSTALIIAGMRPALSVILGTIAIATAPATTVAIARDLKARGPFVDHLYGMLALADAGSILLFAIVTAIAGYFLLPGAEAAVNLPVRAATEIAGSLFLGAAGGGILHLITRKIRRSNEILIISLGLVLLLCSVAHILHLSALLASMTAGAVLANLTRRVRRITGALDALAPPLYTVFFAIAGTKLALDVFSSADLLLLGAVYVLARAAGKVGGVYIGAVSARSDILIRKYLGVAMLPQAGLALGLVLLLRTMPFFAANPDISSTMMNIILFSVLINELAGPPLSKHAVIRGAKL